MSKRSKSTKSGGKVSKKRNSNNDDVVVGEAPLSENVEELQQEVRRLRQRVEEMSTVDILVVWDGEDGGPRVRVAAPTSLRPHADTVLQSVWDTYPYGERRPCATLYRVHLQMTQEAIEHGEPDIEDALTQYNMPNY